MSRYFISITSQFYFCGVPFRLDSYSNCSYDCIYCFSKLRKGNYEKSKDVYADCSKLGSYLRQANKNIASSNIIVECLRRRMPLHWGGMSDPFQPCEQKEKVSYGLLKLLKQYNYPIIISTKSNLIIEEPYFSLLQSYPNLIVQVSLCSSDDKIRKRLESKAPSVRDRLLMISKLTSCGIKVFCRFQPIIQGVNSSDERLLRKIKRAGCGLVIVEHLKIPVEEVSRRIFMSSKIFGYNVSDYYKKVNAKVRGREYVLPSEIKLININRLKRICKKIKLKLSVADNDLQYLGDCNCCCGLDKIKGFENWNKHNIGYAIRKGLERARIKYNIIAQEWCPRKSVRMYLNSNVRKNNNIKTMDGFVKKKWNEAGTINSPTDFYNIELKYKTKGEKVYVYRKK